MQKQTLYTYPTYDQFDKELCVAIFITIAGGWRLSQELWTSQDSGAKMLSINTWSKGRSEIVFISDTYDDDAQWRLMS